jgi:ketosteroid isomerase-like protein
LNVAESTDLENLRALYDDYARGDLSRTDLFDPEIVNSGVGAWPEAPGEVKGIERFSEAMRAWLAAWERPLKVEADDFIQTGNRILVLIRWKGRGKGSGVEMEAEGAHLWTFRDGLAIRFDVYRDRDEAKAALDRG